MARGAGLSNPGKAVRHVPILDSDCGWWRAASRGENEQNAMAVNHSHANPPPIFVSCFIPKKLSEGVGVVTRIDSRFGTISRSSDIHCHREPGSVFKDQSCSSTYPIRDTSPSRRKMQL